MNNLLNRCIQRSTGQVAIQTYALLRIGTGISLVMKYVLGSSPLFNLIQGNMITRSFPQLTFTHTGVYRLAGFHLPYPGLDWLPLPSFEAYAHWELGLLILAIMRTIGLATRYSGALLWIGILYLFSLSQLSYHHHTWLFILTIGILLRTPCGRLRSIDAWIHPKQQNKNTSRTPLRMLQILLSSIYLFSFAAKRDPAWWDGTMMHLYINTSHWLGQFLGSVPGGYTLGGILTLFTMFFLSRAFRRKKTRYIALIWGIIFHLLIDMSLDVSTYSYQMIVLYSVFFADYRVANPSKLLSPKKI